MAISDRGERWLRRAGWCAVVLLAVIGVAAAVGRTMFIDNLATGGEGFRQQLLLALDIRDPFTLERAEEVRRFDERYGDHPVFTLLHVLPGALLLILAPLQFARRIRNRYIRLHRWSGRLLIVSMIIVVVTAFYFGLFMPFGGLAEVVATALFGGFGLVALGRAYRAIRRRDVSAHREWMIRAFAIAIGVSTVRVVGAVYEIALTPAGFRGTEIFVLSLWSGWLLTLGVAELWIRYTRHRSGLHTLPSPAAVTSHHRS